MDEVMGINTGRNTPRLYAPKPITKITEQVGLQGLRHRQDYCGQEWPLGEQHPLQMNWRHYLQQILWRLQLPWMRCERSTKRPMKRRLRLMRQTTWPS